MVIHPEIPRKCFWKVVFIKNRKLSEKHWKNPKWTDLTKYSVFNPKAVPYTRAVRWFQWRQPGLGSLIFFQENSCSSSSFHSTRIIVKVMLSKQWHYKSSSLGKNSFHHATQLRCIKPKCTIAQKHMKEKSKHHGHLRKVDGWFGTWVPLLRRIQLQGLWWESNSQLSHGGRCWECVMCSD